MAISLRNSDQTVNLKIIINRGESMARLKILPLQNVRELKEECVFCNECLCFDRDDRIFSQIKNKNRPECAGEKASKRQEKIIRLSMLFKKNRVDKKASLNG